MYTAPGGVDRQPPGQWLSWHPTCLMSAPWFYLSYHPLSQQLDPSRPSANRKSQDYGNAGVGRPCMLTVCHMTWRLVDV